VPVSKEQLLKSRLPEAEVEIPGVGTVRVRGLSRAEALEMQKISGSGALMIERRMLALAMIEPRMTEGEIREWQEASAAGELEPVTNRITELSGMNDDSARNAYKEQASDPDVEFRVLPGSEALDDGGPDAAGAE
jgi:hypothetical protein